MAHLNKVFLIGRITADLEPPRDLPGSGTRVIKFRLASGRSRKNSQTGQWEPDPNVLYVDCEAFSKADAKFNLVQVIDSYCKKGTQVHITGRLQLDQWTDKSTGQNRQKHKVVVEDLQLLDRAGSGGDGGGQQAAPATYDDGPSDGDIPF